MSIQAAVIVNHSNFVWTESCAINTKDGAYSSNRNTPLFATPRRKYVENVLLHSTLFILHQAYDEYHSHHF